MAFVPLVSLTVVTMTVNLLVMVCVATQKKLHSTPGVYTFSLAVADGLVGLVVMSAITVYTIYGLWPLGQVLFMLWVCTDVVCCTVSILHLIFRLRPIPNHVPVDKLQERMHDVELRDEVLAWVAGV